MKRFLAFLGVFFVVLIGGYLQPVFFPTDRMPQEADSGKQLVSHTALPYEEIKTSGYATYIGEKTDDFITEFGEPSEKLKTAMDYELWIYGEKDTDYLEVNIQDNKISAIKAFNDSKKTAPFSTGMELSDVSELMTIYSNFAFTYKENNYNIELMEEDMNYRPLVAFDNKTFAILFFNHGTGKLAAVTYLDKKTLLTLMPYQLLEGEAIPLPITEQTVGFDAVKSNQVIRVINLLKLKEGLPIYRANTESQKNAQKLFETLANNQKAILSPERAEAWQFSKEEMTSEALFTLTNDEYQKLLKNGQVDKKKATGMYIEPVYDPSFTVLSWFSDSLYYSRFAHQDKENIGVAFSKASMLVLLQETEKEISQTEESE
ncbi:CAP-associated domain-containing protein [Enterococcus crotali]|uniref:CAP-associated domain-containing protein n=1 Tax=Enterococcus crotali TaxID=1453587 RepID=UPI00046F7B11|nr:CAP-associated domain-containing protein [Enterococcus crotali]